MRVKSAVCHAGGQAGFALSTENIRKYDVVQLLYDFPVRLSIEMKQMFEGNSIFQLELVWIKIIIDSQVKCNISIH